MRCGLLILFAGVLALAGCGDGRDDSTPVACLEGKRPYERALAAAPGEVLVGGETPISACLAENQSGGDLATVGTALVAVATRLNVEARGAGEVRGTGAGPGDNGEVPDAEEGGGPGPGEAALRLGYLVGAARRGAAETEGIHADLIRRLEAAARYSPGGEPLPPAFERAYRTGLGTGEAGG